MHKIVKIALILFVIVAIAVYKTSYTQLLAADETMVHSEHDHESEEHDHSDHEVLTEDAHDHEHDEEKNDESSHDDHDHEAHEHGQSIELNHDAESFIAIKTAKVQRGSIDSYIHLNGKIALNEDRLAHVVPYVSGIVQNVTKTLGDSVHEGDVLATIHSRELATAKAEYLASQQRYELAQSVFQREQSLWDKKISSEQDFMQAKIDFAQAGINKTLAEQKLYVFGLDQKTIAQLPDQPHHLFMEYKIRAPFDGIVIDKHITRGEIINFDSAIFTIANLDTVWIDFDVFPKDLPLVKKGQSVHINMNNRSIDGEIMFVSPLLSPETRTAVARVLLPNLVNDLYPGQFVTAQLHETKANDKLIVPQKSVQTINGEKVVFVKSGNEYSLQEVSIGQSNKDYVQILAGLHEGDLVVTDGSFELKSKIVTSTLDSHAGHGH